MVKKKQVPKDRRGYMFSPNSALIIRPPQKK